MPSGPQTLYFIKRGDDFQYVENGVVKSTSTPKPLMFTPDAWRDISIQIVRNQTYFALDRSVSIPLSYVEDAAQIIKYWQYREGLKAKLTLFIAQQKLFLTPTHYGYYYTFLFKGEVDIASYKRNGPKVTVSILESGSPKYIKSNQNVKFEFDINQLQPIKIKMDGVRLRSTTRYNIIRSFAAQALGMKQILPAIKTSTEGYFFNILFQEEIGDLIDLANNTITGFNPATDKRYWFESNANNLQVTIRIKGAIVGNTPTSAGNAGTEWKVETWNSANSSSQNISIGIINTPFNATPVKFDISKTITLQKGERVFLYRMSTTFNNSGFWSYTDDSQYVAEAIDRFKPTFIKAVRPVNLYKPIIEKVTENNYQGESLTLQNYSNIAATCGDAIRSIANPKIKTSLSDFFQSFNSIIGIGLAEIGGKIKLESKVQFIDTTDPIDLGEVSEFEDSYATDYLINQVKVGYQPKEYDDVNGREEFNNTHVYSSPATGISKELNLVSPYRADCYGIEFLRINTEVKTTTDKSDDNDVFLIHISNTPKFDPVEGEYYEVDRSLNPYAEGILEKDSVYNLWLSPKQNLYRNESYIHSCYFKQDTDKLSFQSTEKVSTLKVSEPGKRVVQENEDITIGDLGQRYFDPILLSFKTKASIEIIDILSQNPLKSFRFTSNGIEFKGIPVKVGVAPESYDSQVYQLLSLPQNNLSQLEKIFD